MEATQENLQKALATVETKEKRERMRFADWCRRMTKGDVGE
jgi:hypothetical protein